MAMMFWGFAAAAGGLLATLVTAQVVSRAVKAPKDLPATPLQDRAKWSLVASIPFLLGLILLLVRVGPEAVFEEATPRILFFLLVLSALLALAGGILHLRHKARTDPTRLDEMDHTILAMAPAAQSLGSLVTLTLWTILLVEGFYAEGVVPLPYLSLLFWSCVLVYFLGLPAGILAGYRSQ